MAASLVGMTVVHVLLAVFVAAALVWVKDEPPDPAGSTGATAAAIAALVYFPWMVLGSPIALASTSGVARHRRWAFATTLLYAVLSAPTRFGRPFSVYAFFVLSRRPIRRLFGRG